MKKLIIITLIFLGLTSSKSFSLSNFWYSGLAYTPKGMIIKDTKLDSIDVVITDGMNTITQTITHVPVDSKGIYKILINGKDLNSVSMETGTRIKISINGVAIIMQSLSNWYIFRNRLTMGTSNSEKSVDGWINYESADC